VSTRLKNRRFGVVRIVSNDVDPTVELVHVNRR
jgi:hypothetical protein